MEILVIGTEANLNECRTKFGNGHNYVRTSPSESEGYFKSGMVVFDFQANDISKYNVKGLIVFLNSVTTTLSRLTSGKEFNSSIFGFCGLPTFLNREILELTVLNEDSESVLAKVCEELDAKYKVIADKVGMITPRVICMIINEAYFAIEENVATRADIDLAMKLGTNYPFGPFEWSGKIGLKNVYELLKAVYKENGDDRYKICPLLEKGALT